MSKPDPSRPVSGSPVNGVVPPAAHRFEPGRSGNPKGRPKKGTSLREWLNLLVAKGMTEARLRLIAKSTKAPSNKRAAAGLMLQAIEMPDMADFAPWVRGEKTMAQLKAAGADVDLVKVTRGVVIFDPSALQPTDPAFPPLRNPRPFWPSRL